jgi:hypothetical protein
MTCAQCQGQCEQRTDQRDLELRTRQNVFISPMISTEESTGNITTKTPSPTKAEYEREGQHGDQIEEKPQWELSVKRMEIRRRRRNRPFAAGANSEQVCGASMGDTSERSDHQELKPTVQNIHN